MVLAMIESVGVIGYTNRELKKGRRVRRGKENIYICGRRQILASTSVPAWAETAAVTYLGGRCWKVSSLAAVGGTSFRRRRDSFARLTST
jgi:hypothetical protein